MYVYVYLLGIGTPVHGIDLGKVTPECFPGFHLNPTNHGQARYCLLQCRILHPLPSRLQRGRKKHRLAAQLTRML